MENKRKMLQRRKFLGLLGISSASLILPKSTIASEINDQELSKLLGHKTDVIPEKIIKSLDNADIYVSPEERKLASVLLNQRFRKYSMHYGEKEKKIFMYNIHTGEFYDEVFWADGKYISENINKLNYFMRDFREDKVKPIDLKTVEAIYHVSLHTKKNRPLILNSAYRTPKTNKKIGGARHSQHKLAKAIDFSLDKKDHTSLYALKRFLVNNHNGGVGYYPRQGFIHVDSGHKRYWRG